MATITTIATRLRSHSHPVSDGQPRSWAARHGLALATLGSSLIWLAIFAGLALAFGGMVAIGAVAALATFSLGVILVLVITSIAHHRTELLRNQAGPRSG